MARKIRTGPDQLELALDGPEPKPPAPPRKRWGPPPFTPPFKPLPMHRPDVTVRRPGFRPNGFRPRRE
jgi:hypothetical protein